MTDQTTNLKEIAHDVQRDNPHLGSRADVEHLLKCALNVVLERVATGNTVKFRGFGVFEASIFKGRTLKSPLMEGQGGSVEFKDQLVLRFRQSQSAKQRINEIAESVPKKRKVKAEGAEGSEAEELKTKKSPAKKGDSAPETKKSPAKKPAVKKSKRGKKGTEASAETTPTPAETATE